MIKHTYWSAYYVSDTGLGGGNTVKAKREFTDEMTDCA